MGSIPIARRSFLHFFLPRLDRFLKEIVSFRVWRIDGLKTEEQLAPHGVLRGFLF